MKFVNTETSKKNFTRNPKRATCSDMLSKRERLVNEKEIG